MIPRSLKASSTGLKKALCAFIKTGLTQKEFAEKIELSRSTIANFLAGRSIDRTYFFRICQSLDLNVDEIFEPVIALEMSQIANLKQWVLNDYCQVVAFLEIVENSYIVFKINEEVKEIIFQELSKFLSQIPWQNNQSLFLKNLLSYLIEMQQQGTQIELIETYQSLVNFNQEIQQQEPQIESGKNHQSLVNLSHWLQNIFEGGWQTVEEFLSFRQLNLGINFRRGYIEHSNTNCVRMVKPIDLGMKLKGQSVGLVVALTPKTVQEMEIRLQLHPIDNQNYLPLGIQLIVTDKFEQILIETRARENDNWIQLEINGVKGEFFRVKITLNDYIITEHFVI
ncbi:MAG: DUF1822 family protein [Scytonema sp. PMC 1070.18]|nr:DUF1822 family protein [Scytonema sp. PMC 1070.18]